MLSMLTNLIKVAVIAMYAEWVLHIKIKESTYKNISGNEWFLSFMSILHS